MGRCHSSQFHHGVVVAVPRQNPGNNHSSRIPTDCNSRLTKCNTSITRMIDGDPTSGDLHTYTYHVTCRRPPPNSSQVKTACTGRCLGALPHPSDSQGTSAANAIARNNNLQTCRPPTTPLNVLLSLFSAVREHGHALKPITLCAGRDQRAHAHADTFTCWFID